MYGDAIIAEDLMKEPNASIAAAIAAEAPLEMDTNSLTTLRERVAEARDLEMEKIDLELRLGEVCARLNVLYSKELPELLDKAQVPAITVEGVGNLPPVEVKVKPFYSANIAAAWDEERRHAGFQYLESLGCGDLIKTELTLPFNREERTKAVKVKEALEKKGLSINVKEAVHSATLTAWLKEQVEKKGYVPDLEKIGGTIGRVVTLKGIK